MVQIHLKLLHKMTAVRIFFLILNNHKHWINHDSRMIPVLDNVENKYAGFFSP